MFNLRLCSFLVVLIFALGGPAWGSVDTTDVLQSLLPSERIPRVLNSDDIVLNPNDPEPLFAPNGDFNHDGVDDVAISGIYLLEKGPLKYFLLVAAVHVNPIRYDKLFYQEYDKPVFLHRPGTTGEYDPGTQAFSMTSCASCTDGKDFTWNGKKKSLIQVDWEQRRREYKMIQHAPDGTPDPEKTDLALKIVGALPDVIDYVHTLQKKNGMLGTTARFAAPSLKSEDALEIDVYEKKGSRKIIYDTFEVDLTSKTIVKRHRKVK